MSFNVFRIRRQAHALSRADSSWNPFGHTWKFRERPRRETWDGATLEAQPDPADGSERVLPIHHASTAPDGSTRAFREAAEHHPHGRGPVAFAPDVDTDVFPSQTTTSGDTAVDPLPPPPTAVAAGRRNGLRNRRDGAAAKEEEEEAAAAEDRSPAAAAAAADADADANGKKKPKKSHRLFKNVQPSQPFTVANQLQRTILNSWINVLLVAAPVGIAIYYVKSVNRIAVFVVNFVAIVPLAAMLSFATEEIALRTGETLGGLLNATFGNAVELIVAVMALTQKPAKVVIVQTSLIGSILSNLLLVMGMCFFFGGLRRREQYFNTTVAQTAASLLALAVASIIVPTVFDHNTADSSDVDVPALSRGTSVITLIVYGAYLFFQLKTHHTVFSEESQKVPAKPFKSALGDKTIAQGLVHPAALVGSHGMTSDSEQLKRMLLTPHPRAFDGGGGGDGGDGEDEEEDPQLSFPVAVATLTISTVIIAFCAEFMVDSIDAVTKNGGLSEEFVGLILLPIVGNAAEHATAVTVAIKDKMDLAIGVAVGSSMQVALFILPLLVIIGWGMGLDDMSLSFDLFQVAVLFVSVLLVNYLIGDGKSHWLEGMLLICLYFIIAVCTWWYPSPNE